jgi:hypothetical protein
MSKEQRARIDTMPRQPRPDAPDSFAGLLDEADRALDRAALFLTQHVDLHGAAV